MARPRLEVADVFRRYGDDYRHSHGASLSTAQRRAMTAIERCRTAALGGHVDQCDRCRHLCVSYDSCLMGKIRNGELAAGETSVQVYLNRFFSDLPLFLSP